MLSRKCIYLQRKHNERSERQLQDEGFLSVGVMCWCFTGMETALLGETEALMREGKENRCECLASQHSLKHGLACFLQTVWILVDSGHEGHEKIPQ